MFTPEAICNNTFVVLCSPTHHQIFIDAAFRDFQYLFAVGSNRARFHIVQHLLLRPSASLAKPRSAVLLGVFCPAMHLVIQRMRILT